MKLQTKLVLKRIFVYLKWAAVCAFWFYVFGLALPFWLANILAAWITIELFMHEDNAEEQRLMTPPTIILYRNKNPDEPIS